MPKKILIVEDDRDVREALSIILQLEGYEIALATNGKEALELLQDGSRPALVLTDIMMPVLTGWEFIEAMAADPKIAATPVIILSAAEKRPIPKNGKVVAFLPKPADIGVLIDLIKKHAA